MVPRSAQAALTIRDVLEEYLEDRKRTLCPPDFRLHSQVILFLHLCIDNYGHRNLDEEDRALYEAHYHGSGGRRQFDEIFGADKLLEELSFFTASFLRTDVHASDRVVKKAPDVLSQLSNWLLSRGHVSQDHVDRACEAARLRSKLEPRIRRAVRLLSRRVVGVDPRAVARRDLVECDHHLIARIEPGRLWLHVYRDAAPELIGPLLVPLTVSAELRVGWCLCAALGLLRGRWELIELRGIYPTTDEPPVSAFATAPGPNSRDERAPLRETRGRSRRP